MLKIVLAGAACAAFCLGSAAAWAQPPGHAKQGFSKTEAKAEKGIFERAVDEALGRDDDAHARQRQNPNSNAQWLPGAKRGQARAAERRPAHAGPKHRRGDGDESLLGGLLGDDERSERAKSKRKREKKLGELRKQKRQQESPDDLVGILVEKAKTGKLKN